MNISNSYKQTATLSNTAEIAENESRGSLTPSQSNDFYQKKYSALDGALGS